MNELGITLLWCIGQVTVLTGIVVACYAVARRFGPAAGSLTALSGLVGIVVVTALAFSPWPRWSVFGASDASASMPAKQSEPHGKARETASKNSAEAEEKTRPTGPVERDTVVWSEEDKESIHTKATAFWNSMVNAMSRTAAEVPQTARRWPWIVCGALAVLIVLGLVRLAAGLFVVRAYYRQSKPVNDPRVLGVLDVLQAALRCRKKIELRESEVVATPATIGWKRPVIFLPVDWPQWTEAECHAVLAHEVAHIQRNDFVAWVCAQLGLALHFYHPLVHWLAGRLRLEQELAADAAAAGVAGGQRSYLMTLAAMALRQSERPLAWPARTFLPTRGTFMRRIEMLRDKPLLNSASSVGIRLATVSAVVAAGLFVAGLRGPEAAGGGTAQAGTADAAPSGEKDREVAQAAPATPAGTEKKDPLSVAWVPRDSVFVAAIRPARLLSAPAVAPLKKGLQEAQENLVKEFGVSPERVEQATMFVLVRAADVQQGRTGPDQPGFIIRLESSKDADAVAKIFLHDPEELEYAGRKYFREKNGVRYVFRADERTVILAADEGHVRRILVGGASSSSKAAWFKEWQALELADAAGLFNLEPIRESLNRELNPAAGAPGPVAAIAPVLTQSDSITLALQAGRQLSFRASVATRSADDAKKVSETVSAVFTLAKNAVSAGRAEASRIPNAKESATLLGMLELAEDLLGTVKIEQKDNRVSATAQVEQEDAERIMTLLIPAVTQARSSARRAQGMNNLKQIGLALHNYHDVNKSFPPAVLFGPDGKTPYSWRVAILPYVEGEALFRQYNFTEPWDSENNKKVLAKMPAVFRDPNDPEGSTNASYFALTGPTTIFSGKEGTQIQRITDGTSNTLMVVEAKRDIPWTKPDDIPYAADKAVPKLGGHYPDGFLGLIADGSVRFFSSSIDEKVLRGLFTKEGGERVFDPVPALPNPRLE